MFKTPEQVEGLFGSELGPEDEKLKGLAIEIATILQQTSSGRAKSWVLNMSAFIEQGDYDPHYRTRFPQLEGKPLEHNTSVSETDIIKLRAFAGNLENGDAIRRVSGLIENPDRLSHLLSHFKLALRLVQV